MVSRTLLPHFDVSIIFPRRRASVPSMPKADIAIEPRTVGYEAQGNGTNNFKLFWHQI